MSKKKSGMQIYTKQDKAILYCGYALLAPVSYTHLTLPTN